MVSEAKDYILWHTQKASNSFHRRNQAFGFKVNGLATDPKSNAVHMPQKTGP
jgi:hypothetical protein